MPPTRRTATVELVRGSVRGTRRRALATLPSLFTLGNMFCGFFAILVSIRGQYTLAAVLIGLSVLFDITDGAGAAGLHPVLAGAGRVGSAGLGGLLRVGGLRGDPAGPVQHHDRPDRRQAVLHRHAQSWGRRRRPR